MEELDIKDGIFYLYCYRTIDNKHYVGISKNINRRFSEHKQQKTHWTKKHKPEIIIYSKCLGYMSYKEAEVYEDAFTLEMMMYYDLYTQGGHFFKNMKKSLIKRKYNEIPNKYKNIIQFRHRNNITKEERLRRLRQSQKQKTKRKLKQKQKRH